MNDFWSEESQENTKRWVFPYAIMKNKDHKYGIYLKFDDRIEIREMENSLNAIMPMPSSEIIATFKTVDEMVDAGWVLD